MEIDQPAPDFALPDLHGRIHRLGDYRGRITIVNFWSAECPHSERADRSIMEGMLRWGGDVALLSVASNRNEPAAMLMEAAEARHLPGVLLDGEHAVADLYEVQVTPDAFVLDPGGILRYHGAVDNVTFSRRSPTRFPLEEAVEALLAGRQPELGEMPAFGCALVREI